MPLDITAPPLDSTRRVNIEPRSKVPKGRLNACTGVPFILRPAADQRFSRPFGTGVDDAPDPAINRRAIIESSLRDEYALRQDAHRGTGRADPGAPDSNAVNRDTNYGQQTDSVEAQYYINSSPAQRIAPINSSRCRSSVSGLMIVTRSAPAPSKFVCTM